MMVCRPAYKPVVGRTGAGPAIRRAPARGYVFVAFGDSNERSGRGRDLLVDRVGGQHRLDHHDGGAEDAGAVVEGRAGDADAAGGECGGAAVDDLADAGEQVLVGVGDVAADDDHAGGEEVDGGGQDAAEFAAGLADEAHRFGAAVADVADDVAAVGGVHAELGQAGGHGAAA